MKNFVTVVLMLAIATPAAADVRQSAAREATRAAVRLTTAEQARPNASGQSGENPYLVPSLALLAVGSVVTLYGMAHDTGVACNSNQTLTSVSCGATKSKATIFTGLGLVGVGTFLFVKGKKRSNSPELLFGAGTVAARQRLTW